MTPSAVEMLRAVRKVITHEGCPDGIASAMIIHDALPNAEVVFMQYDTDAHRDLVAETGMLFCDFTPHASNFQAFILNDAIVLDHHKGAEALARMFVGVFADEVNDPGVGGAMLAYQHVWLPLVGDKRSEYEHVRVRELATLIGIRDTWQRHSGRWDDACALAEGLRFFPLQDWFKRRVFDNATLWEKAIDVGNILIAKRTADVVRAVAGAHRFTTTRGTRVVVFEGMKLTSDAADLIETNADLIVGFDYTGAQGALQQLVFSTRSHTGFDCAAFCKHFGGGGHTAAAGFSLKFAPGERVVPDPYTALIDHVANYEAQP